MKILSQKYVVLCTVKLLQCLSDFIYFYFIIITLQFPWPSVLFCTLQRVIQQKGKAEWSYNLQFTVRAGHIKAAQKHLPTTPQSNAANESDTDFKYTNRNPWRWISQNETLWFRSLNQKKLKDCFGFDFVLYPHLANGWSGEADVKSCSTTTYSGK